MLAVGERLLANILLRAEQGADALQARGGRILGPSYFRMPPIGRRWAERLGPGRSCVGDCAGQLRQDLKVLAAGMSVERYLNHPTFGMLYRVCPVAAGEEIYATLYAQRMFFASPPSRREPALRRCRFPMRAITLSKTCCA